MNKLMIIAMIGVLCGCRTSNCLVAETATPVKGERYTLHFRTLKIVQVCNDRVHAMHHSYKGLRIGVIPIDNDYVTGAYLRPATYEYLGPYTYQTIRDENGNSGTNTIRLFKEVPME